MSRGCEQEGLEEVTSDIGRLVNLTTLFLGINGHTLTHLPDPISCLQSLEHLTISLSNIQQLPDGLAMLPNLAKLRIEFSPGVRLPLSLQVIVNDDNDNNNKGISYDNKNKAYRVDWYYK